MPISLNLDVTKLDKRKFFKGKKGVYANIMLWEVEPNSESAEYGDFIVKQQGERGDKMPILGNGKHVDFDKKKGGRSGKPNRQQEDEESSIPF